MKIQNLIFFFLTILALGFFTYRITLSYFSNSGSSTDNILSAAAVFPSVTPTNTPTPTITPSPAIANHLVINEVLYDTISSQNIDGPGGSNRGEFVEIYNPTGASVDLTGWTIEDNTSSESLTGNLPAAGYLILTGATESEFEAIWTVPSTTTYVQAGGGTIGNGLANGGDTVVLKNDTTVIDKMSWGTDTTGFSSGCSGSCPTAPSGQSRERSPTAVDTDSANDFINKNPPTPGS